MLVRLHLRCVAALLLLLGILTGVPSVRAADFLPAKVLLDQAEFLEQQGEWGKACLVYENLLRLVQDAPEVVKRYQMCLRRYWQVRRHSDLSYRREVLSLDYAQSLRLYTMICDTLRENALNKKNVEAAQLFRKGLEEFDNALSDPFFIQQYLAAVKSEDVRAFRSFLKKTWLHDEKLTWPQALKQLREVALAAQNALPLQSNVVVMEFACGACCALDEYTLYLTPHQLRELCDSLQGESSGLGSQPSVAFEMKNDQLGYLQIACFQQSTLQELDDALATLNTAGMKVLLLDIRGNSGGLFETAIDVARRFLPSGVITSTQNSDPKFRRGLPVAQSAGAFGAVDYSYRRRDGECRGGFGRCSKGQQARLPGGPDHFWQRLHAVHSEIPRRARRRGYRRHAPDRGPVLFP